ncbi:hypothetical protein BJ165DRAFT_1500959 [Panaeolus papilionaceus]|nr:hypothetical protein BJ165DRAFT_1500959 [Panaeolus papilionaceus]
MIDRKYWKLSSNERRLEQKYQKMIKAKSQTPVLADDPSRRRPTFGLASHPQIHDPWPMNPDQGRQNDTGSSVPPTPERDKGSSFSALADTDVVDPSAIPLRDVRTHRPANVGTSESRPPLPHTLLSNTSTLYPPGQTPPPMLGHDGQLTSSPRSSLDIWGEGGTAMPP